MDTRAKSLKQGYGKVDDQEEEAYKRKTRKRIIIFSISLALLLVLIIGVVAGRHHHNNNKKDVSSSAAAHVIKSICSLSVYPGSCFSSLQSSNSTNPQKIFQYSLMVVRDSLEKVSSFPDEYAANRRDIDIIDKRPRVKEALKVCRAVLNDAVESLNDSILQGGNLDDLRTWLSTVITDQETCLEALEEVNATFVDQVKLLMNNSTEFASNSLAIVTNIPSLLTDHLKKKKKKIPSHRRRLLAWVDRRLLQETKPTPDVTVAADGSGDVTTIAEAVDKIPKKNATRFVIHVKAGTYVENVVLDKSYWNVMMYGDGKALTIISGSKNFIDGTPTFSTPTFAVAGKGFIGRDIGFINTAGAIKHQAVAVRSGSDESVFYRCSFDSFQDTLYAHSNRQFYRDCDITGTIDFIFGNAAVVFQNCNILPRQPLPNQFVTITAQGKKDPNQNTGISIQRCTMSPLDALTAPTYLGRPWKDYSVTVIMETNIGGFLDPKGWISWISNVDPPTSILYAEYQNTGPGSSTGSRVTWAGYKPTLTPDQASKYTVQSLIQGPSWLPATTIAYDET